MCSSSSNSPVRRPCSSESTSGLTVLRQTKSRMNSSQPPPEGMMPLWSSPYASSVKSTSSSSEISMLHSVFRSFAATPLNWPDPSSMPAGISGSEWLATGTRAWRVRMVYSLPSHSRMTRTPTAPPRMKTMPGALTMPFTPPQFTLAVDWNLMKPTFEPNMSTDCTWMPFTNRRGSSSTSDTHSRNTCDFSTTSRSMPGSAVIGTLVRPPSTASISICGQRMG